MWHLKRACVILALVGSTIAAPQQQSGANLDTLIADVFNTGDTSGGKVAGQTSSTPTTILGSQNEPTGDSGCECVPYYQCQNNTITTDGIGLIDIRSGFTVDYFPDTTTIRGTCENYLDICCKPPDVLKPEDKITPPPPPARKGCGQRNPDGVGFRITGQTDNEAQFGEFPWMVAILRDEVVGSNGQKLNVYQCGGALIHRSAVLTAAHCVSGKQPSQLKIRAGEWDTQTKNELFAHQDRDVEKVIVHEKFHSGALYNDVAILILKTPVDIAENVDVVCLPQQGEEFDGSRCFASGWGKDVFGKEGQYQVILKRVDLPVVSHSSCETALRQTRLGKYFILDKSFMCAGGEANKDTCKGDGGSPLVCPLKNDPTRYAEAGIVSWGIGCGENQTPGVYANIGMARQWIDEQMVFNQLDITVYQA